MRCNRESQLVRLCNEFLGRSTTKMEDIHGMLANLLDFDATKILSLRPEDRTKALLCAQDYLPIGILFSNSSRFVSEGYLNRWVPQCPAGSWVTGLSESAEIVAGQGLRIHGRSVVGFWLPASKTRRTSFCLVNITNRLKKWWMIICCVTRFIRLA